MEFSHALLHDAQLQNYNLTVLAKRCKKHQINLCTLSYNKNIHATVPCSATEKYWRVIGWTGGWLVGWLAFRKGQSGFSWSKVTCRQNRREKERKTNNNFAFQQYSACNYTEAMQHATELSSPPTSPSLSSPATLHSL